MIVELLLLVLAISILTAGFAILNYVELLRHKVRVLEVELNTLKDKIEIQGNYIDHIHNVLISMNGELISLKKEIHPTDTDIKN